MTECDHEWTPIGHQILLAETPHYKCTLKVVPFDSPDCSTQNNHMLTPVSVQKTSTFVF